MATSTIVVPEIQQILIEDKCAAALINSASSAKYDIDHLRNNGYLWISGFCDRTESTISFDDANRRLTIAPTTSAGYRVTLNGACNPITTTKTIQWDDTEGVQFVYLDANQNLALTNSFEAWAALFINNTGAGVVQLYWDATNKQSIRRHDERHSNRMPGATRVYLHRYFGTQWESGGALSGFTFATGAATLPAHAQFAVGDSVIADEDERYTLTNGVPQTFSPAARIPIFYLTGSGIWRRKAADDYPLIYSGTAGYTGANGLVAWNQLSGGTWSLQEVASGDYVLVHYFLTGDTAEPLLGVLGQATYANAPDARAGAPVEIFAISGLSKLLSTEKRAIASVLFQTATASSNVPKAKTVQVASGVDYEDWRLDRSLPP